MSYHGYFAATALCHRMRSGKPASLRFFQQTSWNAFERFAVPMPSICTTMKPEVGQRREPAERAERLRHERALRPGVDATRSPGTSSPGRSSRGRQMMPQMSVLPSRPLATKTSGGSQPLAFSSVMSASSSLQTSLPSSARRSSWTGGMIDAADRCRSGTCRSGEYWTVCVPLPVGQGDQAGAVEVDAVVVDEVRVLVRRSCRWRGTRPAASPRRSGRCRGRRTRPW